MSVACLPPLAPHSQPGPGWPDLAEVPDSTEEGQRDAAIVVSLDDPELGGRPGAREVGDAWVRELVHRQGIPARRVWVLRDRRATPARLRRVLARAKQRVPVGGSLWFVFIGRGHTAAVDQPGLLQLAPHRDGSTLPQLTVWAALGFGPQHSAFAVIDACDDAPPPGQVGGLPALRLEWRGEAVEAIVVSPQDRSLMAGGDSSSGTGPGIAGQTPRPPGSPQLAALGQMLREVTLEAMREGVQMRLRPASLASMSAGVGSTCAARLPGGEGPALGYAMLGALRGWADADADGQVTAEEATRYVGRVVRHDWSPGYPVPSPEAAGVNLVLARSSGQSSPALELIAPAASTETERAALPELRLDFSSLRHIPAGRFAMGCAPTDDACEADESVPGEVMVMDFTLDRTEVTWSDYADCVEAGGCSKIDLDACYVYQPDQGFELGGGLDRELVSGDRPVVCATWPQADQYCAWRGQRLPREIEWEKAARGTDRRRYPWGDDEPTCELANLHGCGPATHPVGRHPAGASPYGMLDMAGNVWEWTHDWYDEEAYRKVPRGRPPRAPDEGRVKVVRGGSFYDYPQDLRSSYRYGLTPGLGYSTVGFRCAR